MDTFKKLIKAKDPASREGKKKVQTWHLTPGCPETLFVGYKWRVLLLGVSFRL